MYTLQLSVHGAYYLPQLLEGLHMGVTKKEAKKKPHVRRCQQLCTRAVGTWRACRKARAASQEINHQSRPEASYLGLKGVARCTLREWTHCCGVPAGLACKAAMADLEAEMARFEAELASVSGAAGARPQREVDWCFLA